MTTSSNGNLFQAQALCVGNLSVTSEYPSKRTVTWDFYHYDVNTKRCRCLGPYFVHHQQSWWRRHFHPHDSNVGILENKSTLLTISRLWRYCGPSNYRFNFLLYWYAPWVFFEDAHVLSCSPFMFENTENKQLDWRIRHSHLASTLFHSLVRWWSPWRIRPQITRLSELENSAMGTWPIYNNSIIPDWFEKMAWCKILIQVLIV